MARMSAGDSVDGLDLIKRQWGYMINSPNSTQSTFWEGFQANGQFAFQGIYMSHAHGWATGPAPALTFYVLGIRPHSSGGRKYLVAPQIAELKFCNGSLAFGKGSVHVAWSVQDRFTLIVDATSHPTAETGYIGLPLAELGLTPRTARITTKADTQSSMEIKAIHPSAWGWREGRLWYQVDQPWRFTITVERRDAVETS